MSTNALALCVLDNDNLDECLHIAAHMLGMCGPGPIPPGRLVLSIRIRTIYVQLMKVGQNNIIPYLPRSTPRSGPLNRPNRCVLDADGHFKLLLLLVPF